MQTFDLERFDTPTGSMLLVTDGELVRAADWDDGDRLQRLLRQHYGEVVLRERASPSVARRAFEAYFAGDLTALEAMQTKTNGTEFQRTVWNALRAIPAHETLSYGTLAARIGKPTAARAVGHANGANPIHILVPCHRVIGASSALTGYGGGLERKRWLLAHEGALP